MGERDDATGGGIPIASELPHIRAARGGAMEGGSSRKKCSPCAALVPMKGVGIG